MSYIRVSRHVQSVKLFCTKTPQAWERRKEPGGGGFPTFSQDSEHFSFVLNGGGSTEWWGVQGPLLHVFFSLAFRLR